MPARPLMPAFAEPAEPSLTGHILAQGRPDLPVPRQRITKLVVMMLVVLGVLVIGGLTAAVLAGDQLTKVFSSFFEAG